MQCTITTNVCVCSSHPVTGDLMFIAVDQTDRALERTCSLSTASVFNNHHLRQLTKPHLSTAQLQYKLQYMKIHVNVYILQIDKKYSHHT